MKTTRTLGFSPYAYGGSIFPFQSVFAHSKDVLNEAMDGVDAIALWGGTDIDPKYYLQDVHPRTSHNPVSMRDFHEWKMMEKAHALSLPIIGICRGAQFLCAYAGGRLVQHVTGHNGGSHEILVVKDGLQEEGDGLGLSTENQVLKPMRCTTAHHQMLYLGDLKEGEDYHLLAWTPHALSDRYDGKDANEQLTPAREPEVVYFPKIKGFAIQGHPEWMKTSDEFVKWCLKEITKLCPFPEKVEVPA